MTLCSNKFEADGIAMLQTDTAFLPIARLSPMLDACELTATDLVRLALERAEGSGRGLNCFIRLLTDDALAEAAASDRRAAEGRRLGPLDGIPVALKDNTDVAGVPPNIGREPGRERGGTYG